MSIYSPFERQLMREEKDQLYWQKDRVWETINGISAEIDGLYIAMCRPWVTREMRTVIYNKIQDLKEKKEYAKGMLGAIKDRIECLKTNLAL